MKTVSTYLLVLLLSIGIADAQTGPWNNPLMMARSTDGITFDVPVIFQDSSGVPCVIKWQGDTLISAFQWFRLPLASPSWDRVAVKFSYDKGLTWTEPVPIEIPDLPAGYQRPFDPTLAVAGGNKIRIYFSSGMTGSMMLDSLINTYSAISTDGIHYSFEINPRYDHPTTRAIDPAVIFFHGMWHYASPYGPPNIAYHAISSDGINFSKVPDIMGDMMHNWTGNYMVNDTGELRFYGCGGPYIWYNHSANGGAWDGYVNTNLGGGDPSVVKVDSGNYLIVYTGKPYALNVAESPVKQGISIYPNPVKDLVYIDGLAGGGTYRLMSIQGIVMQEGQLIDGGMGISTKDLEVGLYLIEVTGSANGSRTITRVVKE